MNDAPAMIETDTGCCDLAIDVDFAYTKPSNASDFDALPKQFRCGEKARLYFPAYDRRACRAHRSRLSAAHEDARNRIAPHLFDHRHCPSLGLADDPNHECKRMIVEADELRERGE